MKTIKLPDGTEFVPFDGHGGVGFLVAAAEFPSEDLLTERMRHDWALGAGLLDAVRQGRLRVRDFCTKLPLRPDAPGSQVLSSVVSVNNLREFVAELGCAVQVGDEPDGAASQERGQAAPAAPPQAVLMPRQAVPRSVPSLANCLPTPQVATVFDGLPFTAENWPKRLSGSGWLHPARRSAGEQGGLPATWCPLALAMAIHAHEKDVKEKTATLRKLHSLFKRNELLAQHCDAWCEYFHLVSND